MQDQSIMENLLLTTKGACDLYMHGTVESSTANVHQVFDTALGQTLDMQDTIYKTMQQRGWYQGEQAQAQEISKVKQKYTMQ